MRFSKLCQKIFKTLIENDSSRLILIFDIKKNIWKLKKYFSIKIFKNILKSYLKIVRIKKSKVKSQIIKK